MLPPYFYFIYKESMIQYSEMSCWDSMIMVNIEVKFSTHLQSCFVYAEGSSTKTLMSLKVEET